MYDKLCTKNIWFDWIKWNPSIIILSILKIFHFTKKKQIVIIKCSAHSYTHTILPDFFARFACKF